MDARAQNSDFIKYVEHVIRRAMNHSEIDGGGPTDSKNCRSEEARRRVVQMQENQVQEQHSQERSICGCIQIGK
jgi:hypothetical protein